MKKLLMSSMLMTGLLGFQATLPVSFSDVAFVGVAGTAIAGGGYIGAGMPGFGTALNGIENYLINSSNWASSALANTTGAALDVGRGIGQAGVAIGTPFYYAGSSAYHITKDMGALSYKLGQSVKAFVDAGSIGVHACGDFVKKHPTALAAVAGSVISYHYIYKPACEWWEKNSWWSKKEEKKEKKEDKKITISW